MDQLAVRPIKLKKGHDGEWTEMKMRWNLKEKGNVKPIKLNSKHMIVINGNDYNNAYGESNDNKTKIKKWITKKNKSTTNMCCNKNNNNRNYKNIDNNYHDNNCNNNN